MTEENLPLKKEKKKPEGLVIPPKKPKLSKAERRALQEEQRAAKSTVPGEGGSRKEVKSIAIFEERKTQDRLAHAVSPAIPLSHPPLSSIKSTITKEKENLKTVSLFSHLIPYRDPSSVFINGATLKVFPSPPDYLHPAVIALGHRYAHGQIRGGNARCKAMLNCFASILHDYEPTSGTSSAVSDLRTILDHNVLKPSFQYWTETCRPHSVSMGNAFTFLKTAVASIDREMAWEEMRSTLLETMEAYAKERIDFADQAIADLALSKLNDKEVVLVYGHSDVIQLLLLKHFWANRNFRVIIIDNRPLLEGRRTLKALREAGVDCTYVLLNALTYVLQENVSKVLLGASALMSDGSVLGRVGTACVALAAHKHNIPVLVCCETYKISNRVQLESITHNELGNPEALLNEDDVLQNWKEIDGLKLLNVLYDLTPAAFVSGIVTELGIVPPTSVAVLLREMDQGS